MLGIDPERLMAAVAAAPGALIYGMFHLATLWLSGQPAGRADYVKAGVNIGAALVAGVLVAAFAGPAIKAAMPLAALKDIHLVGIVIGAFAWELLPVLYAVAKGRLKKVGDGE